MQGQLKKVCFCCAAVCIAILLGSALAAGAGTGRKEDIRPWLRDSRISLDDWVSIEDGGEHQIITFPYEVQKNVGIFQCRIPDTVTEEDVLVFSNLYQQVVHPSREKKFIPMAWRMTGNILYQQI